MRFLWPTISVTACGTTAVLVAFDDGALRAAVALAFVLVMPGLSLVRLLAPDDVAATLGMSVALSLALAVILPTTLLYADAWSPPAALAGLIAITLAATVVEVVRS